ncbi:MAG: hypothetical protein R3B49_01385 [Phycisphaerales bacterium]
MNEPAHVADRDVVAFPRGREGPYVHLDANTQTLRFKGVVATGRWMRRVDTSEEVSWPLAEFQWIAAIPQRPFYVRDTYWVTFTHGRVVIRRSWDGGAELIDAIERVSRRCDPDLRDWTRHPAAIFGGIALLLFGIGAVLLWLAVTFVGP